MVSEDGHTVEWEKLETYLGSTSLVGQTCSKPPRVWHPVPQIDGPVACSFQSQSQSQPPPVDGNLASPGAATPSHCLPDVSCKCRSRPRPTTRQHNTAVMTTNHRQVAAQLRIGPLPGRRPYAALANVTGITSSPRHASPLLPLWGQDTSRDSCILSRTTSRQTCLPLPQTRPAAREE